MGDLTEEQIQTGTVVRLQVLLAKDVADTLKELAHTYNTTITEQVRRAITLLKFFYDHFADKNEIVVRDEDGKLRAYHFFW